MYKKKIYKLASVTFLLINLTACNSGATAGGGSPQMPARGTTNQYTDATWLFNNYFQPYATFDPEEKADIMESLKQYANGFNMEIQMPNININEAIDNFHQNMVNSIFSEGGLDAELLIDSDDEESYVDPSFVAESFTSEQMAQMVSAGEGVYEDINLDLQEQQATSEQYNAPYQLSESVEQYILSPDNSEDNTLSTRAASAW